ncbi:MAG TPA: hypothetical protein DCG57_10235 [Candidatus Riflebacteria bacterium]|jgi:type II secretory pathway pseudopilin PulG|nr:hypothetical protein [Candidatus Riflebacteria bacterium]
MTEISLMKTNRGMSFVEVLLAVIIASLLFSSIIWFVSSTRVATGKSTNYLRALQLAQETIDWVHALEFSNLTEDKLSLLEGSLVDSQTGHSVVLAKSNVTGKESVLAYPDDYCKSYFYRRIVLEKLSSVKSGSRLLKKVSVHIYWNEGQKPAQVDSLSAEPDRMRQITLSTLLFDERGYY